MKKVLQQITLFVVITILASSCNAVATSKNTENVFLWNEANNRFLSAKSANDYLESAKRYQQLINSGIKNWQLYFNFGTALLSAGLYEQAIDALELAEQLCGKNPDIEKNLIVAYSKKEGAVIALPWYRKVFFWHFNYSITGRIKTAITLFAMFWLVLILRKLNFRVIAKHLLPVIMLALLICFSSLFVTFHKLYTFNPILPSIEMPTKSVK